MTNLKEVICKNCGDPIEQGYAVNPENSEVCENCLTEDEP